MDPSSEWRGSLPQQNNEPQPIRSQPSAFPTNISSYFRRPAKVVKTGSRGSSPKNLSRRRTTASHTTTRNRGAIKGSISNYATPGTHGNVAAVSTRPISWHPNSFDPTFLNDWAPSNQFPDSAYPIHFLTNPFSTTEVNGLITPLTQPSSAESCYNETFTPLDNTRTQSLDNAYVFPEQPGYNTFWLSQQNASQQYFANPPQMYQGTNSMNRQTPFTYPSAPDAYTGTAPPTPDFPATSNYPSFEEPKHQSGPESEDEVLVGMGLYDPPSSPKITGMYGSQITLPHRGSTGKGLKLEETFEPSPEDDGSDDDDECSNHEETEAEEQNGACVPAPTEPPSANPILTGQSFFFDNDPEEEQLVPETYEQHFTAPIWSDAYSGVPFTWV
jgi:hypothetical protein